MMMPSLFNQFVPSVSSMDDTFFMRCCSVGFAAGTRSAAAGEGLEIRAATAGGTFTFDCGGVAEAGGTEAPDVPATNFAEAGAAGCIGGGGGGAGFFSAEGGAAIGAMGFGSAGTTGLGGIAGAGGITTGGGITRTGSSLFFSGSAANTGAIGFAGVALPSCP